MINNILTIISPSQLYDNGVLYSSETSDSDYISLSIKYPKNGITITEVSGIDYTLIYKIYPSGMTPVPSDANINNTNLFNKIVITKIDYNIKATFIFYIYIGVYTYNIVH